MLNFGSLQAVTSDAADGNEYRILVIADALGVDHLDVINTDEKKRLVQVDRDNVDAVIAKLNPTIEFEDLIPSQSLSRIEFDSVDSLHPDEIFDRADVFEHLRKLKRQLKGNMQQQAIDEIRSWGTDAKIEAPANEAKIDNVPSEYSTEGLFDDVLDGTSDTGDAGNVDWSKFIEDILKPIQVQTVDPNIKQYEAIVDQAIEMTMRKILDHPRFKAVEATWRGLEWLTRRIDSDVQVKVFLMSMSKEALIKELSNADELQQTELFRYIVEQTVQTPGGKLWSMVCGNYHIGLSETEIQTIGRLANIVAAGKSKLFFSVGAELAHFENETYAQRWDQLKNIPAARSTCAMAPRFLLRLPYGKGGSRTEQFNFEEEIKNSNNRLWGSPGLLAASALGEDFERNGAVDSTQVFTFGGFAMHAFAMRGVEDIMISGERMMADDEIGAWIELGITPIVSYKDSDKIQISGFQSLQRSRLG